MARLWSQSFSLPQLMTPYRETGKAEERTCGGLDFRSRTPAVRPDGAAVAVSLYGPFEE